MWSSLPDLDQGTHRQSACIRTRCWSICTHLDSLAHTAAPGRMPSGSASPLPDGGLSESSISLQCCAPHQSSRGGALPAQAGDQKTCCVTTALTLSTYIGLLEAAESQASGDTECQDEVPTGFAKVRSSIRTWALATECVVMSTGLLQQTAGARFDCLRSLATSKFTYSAVAEIKSVHAI